MNLLARMNRELRAEFELARFAHRVEWNDHDSRVELYLESVAHQRVRIGELNLVVDLAAGERIHTESSYKLTDEHVARLLVGSGFHPERTWYDEERRFGMHLARVPVPPPPPRAR